MLSSFTIRNFKSIVNLTIDFNYAEGKAPNGYKELETIPFIVAAPKKKLVPCLAVYGANASGKTNIIKALFTIKEVIENGIKGCFFPNRLNREFSDTFFSIDFYIGRTPYTYVIQYNDKEIINESLLCKDKIIYAITKDTLNFENIATRTYNQNKLHEIFAVECKDAEKKQRFTFLNKIAAHYAGLNKHITGAFDYLTKNVEVYPINLFPMAFDMEKLVESGSAAEINEAFEKIVLMLRKLDIDISRMSFERLPVDMEKINEWAEDSIELIHKNNEIFINNVYSYHKNTDGNEVRFKFREESDGTQIVAGIVGVFLSVLSKGGVLVIDELERSLHPLLLTEIIRLFKTKRYNVHNAQLIFTAHNTDILDNDLLRVSEIGIVKKTLKSGTMLRKIAEFDGIRNVSNFRRQYLQGSFSGIPYPYI